VENQNVALLGFFFGFQGHLKKTLQIKKKKNKEIFFKSQINFKKYFIYFDF
jgi:hypothetical protein